MIGFNHRLGTDGEFLVRRNPLQRSALLAQGQAQDRASSSNSFRNAGGPRGSRRNSFMEA